jgi:hypothetical protein
MNAFIELLRERHPEVDVDGMIAELREADEMPAFNELKLRTLKASELKMLCTFYKIPASGTKDAMILRLVAASPPLIPEADMEIVKARCGSVQDILKKMKKTPPAPKKAVVLERMPRSRMALRRNAHGNYEHPSTRFVFDPVLAHVIGVQQDDGTVRDLTAEDRALCLTHNFSFRIPDVLEENE